MTAEVDQAIKEKYLSHQGLQSRIEGLHQKWKNHDRRIANLPPIVKPVASFLDGFRRPEGFGRIMSWHQEASSLFQEVTILMKNNPGIHKLTHLTYNAYTARDLIGFPEFSYGFRYEIDGNPLDKPFDGPLLFWSNGVLARRDDDVPLIEVRKDEPPLLYLPENFVLIITKRKGITEIDIDPDEPDVVYAAWRPEITNEPRAIKVAEDVVIPWKDSIDEIEVFTDTEDVRNLEYR